MLPFIVIWGTSPIKSKIYYLKFYWSVNRMNFIPDWASEILNQSNPQINFSED